MLTRRLVPSAQQARVIVNNALKLYSQDKTGMVDFALESGGESGPGGQTEVTCPHGAARQQSGMRGFGKPESAALQWPVFGQPLSQARPGAGPSCVRHARSTWLAVVLPCGECLSSSLHCPSEVRRVGWGFGGFWFS